MALTQEQQQHLIYGHPGNTWGGPGLGVFDETVGLAAVAGASPISHAMLQGSVNFSAAAVQGDGTIAAFFPSVPLTGAADLTPQATLTLTSLMTLLGEAVLTTSGPLLLSESMNLSAEAVQGDGTTGVFAGGLALTSGAAMDATVQALHAARLSLTATAILALMETITKEESLQLSGAVAVVPSPAATFNTLMSLLADLTAPLTGTNVLTTTADLSASVAAAWLDSLQGLLETMSLSAAAAATPIAQAQYETLATLVAGIQDAMAISNTLGGSSTLTADVATAILGTFPAVVEVVLLEGALDLTPSATADLAGVLALALSAALSAQVQATMASLLSLGVQPALVPSVAVAFADLMTLNLQGLLTTAGAAIHPNVAQVLVLAAQTLKSPSVTETLALMQRVESLTTAHPEDETLDP